MTASSTVRELFTTPAKVGSDGRCAIAAVALAGTMLIFAHGGVGSSGTAPRQLDLLGGVLAACASLPLLVWRRSPMGVFAATTAVVALFAVHIGAFAAGRNVLPEEEAALGALVWAADMVRR